MAQFHTVTIAKTRDAPSAERLQMTFSTRKGCDDFSHEATKAGWIIEDESYGYKLYTSGAEAMETARIWFR